MTRWGLIAWVLIPLLLASGVAGAADDEADKLRELLRATVLQLRELQDQRAAAYAAKPPPAATVSGYATLKATLSATPAQLRAARREAGDAATAKASLDKSKADYDALSAKAVAEDAELEKCKAALTQASRTPQRAAGAERRPVAGRARHPDLWSPRRARPRTPA